MGNTPPSTSGHSGSGLAILLLLLIVAVAIALFVWWLVRLIEAVRIPESAWTNADQNKIVAVLLMILLGVLGTAVYSFAMRPKLKASGALVRRRPQEL